MSSNQKKPQKTPKEKGIKAKQFIMPKLVNDEKVDKIMEKDNRYIDEFISETPRKPIATTSNTTRKRRNEDDRVEPRSVKKSKEEKKATKIPTIGTPDSDDDDLLPPDLDYEKDPLIDTEPEAFLGDLNHQLLINHLNYRFHWNGSFVLTPYVNESFENFDSLKIHETESVASVAECPQVPGSFPLYRVHLPGRDRYKSLDYVYRPDTDSDNFSILSSDKDKIKFILKKLGKGKLHCHTHDLSKATLTTL